MFKRVPREWERPQLDSNVVLRMQTSSRLPSVSWMGRRWFDAKWRLPRKFDVQSQVHTWMGRDGWRVIMRPLCFRKNVQWVPKSLDLLECIDPRRQSEKGSSRY